MSQCLLLVASICWWQFGKATDTKMCSGKVAYGKLLISFSIAKPTNIWKMIAKPADIRKTRLNIKTVAASEEVQWKTCAGKVKWFCLAQETSLVSLCDKSGLTRSKLQLTHSKLIVLQTNKHCSLLFAIQMSGKGGIKRCIGCSSIPSLAEALA